MSKGRRQSVGAELIAGLEQFRDALRDGTTDRLTMRSVELDLEPHDYTPDLVRETRLGLGVSQAVMARLLGVASDTVQAWEQGKREPSAMARRFLDEVRGDPGYWRRRLAAAVVEREGERAPA